MALPLIASGVLEASKLSLSRWAKAIEASCLLVLVAGWLAKAGWVLTVIYLLFTLLGARLALPKNHSQRVQVVFMSFLLFLLTAVANFSISFLPWALIWVSAAIMSLLNLNWQKGADHPRSKGQRPPLRQTPIWALCATLISAAIFVAIPRPDYGRRPMPFGINGLGGSMAGLTDSLSLNGGGGIFGSGEVVARIVPPGGISHQERKAIESRMSLLIGHRLERAESGKWGLLLGNPRTPPRWDIFIGYGLENSQDSIEYYVYPSPKGIIPLPQGALQIQPPPRMRINLAFGGAAQWAYPLARPLPFGLNLGPFELESIDEGSIRWRRLMEPDPESIEALNWSIRVVPYPMDTFELVKMLIEDLHTFRYTLENPSGKAKDPLGDFLTRTRAGHCEYFAHALASALRHRGIASRVVNGYRLGEWIAEGGYWLVTQDDAHSWVEYVDPSTRLWLSADPTPPGAATYYAHWPFVEKMGRMVDALKFRWDRHVVRFSDAQQQKGAVWAIQMGSQLFAAAQSGAGAKPIIAAIPVALVCAGALFWGWEKRGSLKCFLPAPTPLGAIRALRPLVRSARVSPLQGETLRGWIVRLAEVRPDRREALALLAALIERSVYGQSGEDISKPVKLEAAAMRRQARGQGARNRA
jgi:hypothetical protein